MQPIRTRRTSRYLQELRHPEIRHVLISRGTSSPKCQHWPACLTFLPSLALVLPSTQGILCDSRWEPCEIKSLRTAVGRPPVLLLKLPLGQWASARAWGLPSAYFNKKLVKRRLTSLMQKSKRNTTKKAVIEFWELNCRSWKTLASLRSERRCAWGARASARLRMTFKSLTSNDFDHSYPSRDDSYHFSHNKMTADSHFIDSCHFILLEYYVKWGIKMPILKVLVEIVTTHFCSTRVLRFFPGKSD